MAPFPSHGSFDHPASNSREIQRAFVLPELPDDVERFGTHRDVKLHGSGGKGAVLSAEDTKLLRPIAINFMSPALVSDDTPAIPAEARAAARITSGHVVTIYEVDDIDRMP